ncbi:uncharacterized protein BJ171DRAFT_597914 [Polychytrium aggregatum]|uniref:uncharacterized protein n=1 Tax=Polychytrium aggregatum TaxID=110093 RepID=UPI0022FDBCF4|nr:uncharacterized protein BJ171DRAFT_597914 [Polychytrium aggregatum]KAI9206251.1 hypothetical protein BJ171DRAFT_597914 [Polychytrium aggregatum]
MAFLSLDDIAAFSSAGFVLNTEERAALRSSLLLKKNEERLDEIGLWGKILGVQKDYMIAQATGEDHFVRKFFYSTDLVTWLQLPEVTVEEIKIVDTIMSRFYGDPAYEYITAKNEEQESTGDDEPHVEEKRITELKRLSGVIALINHQVQIVPRGAYYRDHLHKLSLNPAFQGLTRDGLGKLTEYFHFCEGFDINTRTIMDRANSFDESIDIFDSLARDEPKGIWSLIMEKSGASVIIRSLLWPGYVFFHSPRPCKWGSFYYGSGQKNLNIGYMLP